MIVTHEPEDDIAYMVVAGFTDETDRNAGAAQWNDSIEYGTARNGSRRLLVTENNV